MEQNPPASPNGSDRGTLDSTTLTAEQQDLIERFGVLHDQLGHSPATGRIIGLLLVAPRPALTFDEIRETLGLSKSSTSAGLNLLLRIGSVEYFTRPGDRRRYFRKNFDDWESAVLKRMDTFLAIKGLLREAHELKKAGPTNPGPEIPRMVDFLDFIQNTVQEAHQRWASSRDAGGNSASPTHQGNEKPTNTIRQSTPKQGDEDQ